MTRILEIKSNETIIATKEYPLLENVAKRKASVSENLRKIICF